MVLELQLIEVKCINLDLKTAKLEAVNNNFQEVKYYIVVHTQLQSSQFWMSSFSSWINASDTGNISFFSFSCGLPSGVT